MRLILRLVQSLACGIAVGVFMALFVVMVGLALVVARFIPVAAGTEGGLGSASAGITEPALYAAPIGFLLGCFIWWRHSRPRAAKSP